jgi:hypothetical protein
MKKMTNIRLNLAAIAVLIIIGFTTQSFTTSPSTEGCPTPPQFVTLVANTPIQLEVAQDYTSEDLEEGHQVDFTVREAVTVDGIEVIHAGALATGKVTRLVKSEKACTTCQSGCAMMQIIVEYVQAVDESRVRIRSTVLNIKAARPDVPAQLKLGKTVSAQTQSHSRIKLQ